MIKNCLHCDSEFRRNDISQKYCCKTCHDKSKRTQVVRTCIACDTVFSREKNRDNKYCSRECFLKEATNKLHRSCIVCETSFTTTPYKNKKCCSKSCFYTSATKEFKQKIRLKEIEDCIHSNIDSMKEISWDAVYIENIFNLNKIDIDKQINSNSYIGCIKRRY